MVHNSKCMAQVLRSILSSAIAPMLIFILVAAFVTIFRLGRVRLPWAVLSVSITAIVAGLAIVYLFLPVLFEDAETDIACISALAMRGLPIYPALDAAQRYILLYGPLTYLAHIPFYWIFGESLAAFKLLGVGALLLSLIGLYRICRSYAPMRASIIGLGCASLVLFRYIGIEFWGRIDPLILVLTVLCIWVIVRGPLWAVLLINGLAFGVIPNLKISGIAYLLPVFALLVMRKSWRVAVASALLGAILLPLPFLLPIVSLSNYLAILKAATEHGLIVNFLIRNLQYSVLLLLPVLVTFYRERRPSYPQMTYLASIVAGLLITSILGSKNGAGSYHLIPYIVPILHLYFWRRSERAPHEATQVFANFAIAWAVTTLFLASTHLQALVRTYRDASLGRRIVAEVVNEETIYRGRTIEVGIGKDFEDPRTRYAYLPTFAGQPYTISGAAIRDLQIGDKPIPDATIQYLKSCGTQVWLIPKGDAPFSATNSYYETPHDAFDAPFQAAFIDRYHRVSSDELFDVWICGQ
jgi:hypothetical protein